MAKQRCPVCRRICEEDAPYCPCCGWELSSGLIVGELSEDDTRAYESRLAIARRNWKELTRQRDQQKHYETIAKENRRRDEQSRRGIVNTSKQGISSLQGSRRISRGHRTFQEELQRARTELAHNLDPTTRDILFFFVAVFVTILSIALNFFPLTLVLMVGTVGWAIWRFILPNL